MKHPFQLRSPLFSVSSFFRGHPLTTCLQLNIRKRMNRYPMCFVQYGNGPIKKRSEKKKSPKDKNSAFYSICTLEEQVCLLCNL